MLLDWGDLERATGGESGIRTHVRVSPKHAFQACAFNHSAISPVAEKASDRSLRAASNEAFISISCPRRSLEAARPPGLRIRHASAMARSGCAAWCSAWL